MMTDLTVLNYTPGPREDLDLRMCELAKRIAAVYPGTPITPTCPYCGCPVEAMGVHTNFLTYTSSIELECCGRWGRGAL